MSLMTTTSATAARATVMTPMGPFTIVADVVGEPTVLASGFTDDVDELLAVVSPRLRPSTVSRGDVGGVDKVVIAYVDGDLTALDQVAVRQASGPFLEHAWTVLREVPAGPHITYAEFAARCGRPDAVRAAAGACARNAAALFVPCHRVVRTGGGLGGFRWGLDVKRWLLDHEAAVA